EIITLLQIADRHSVLAEKLRPAVAGPLVLTARAAHGAAVLEEADEIRRLRGAKVFLRAAAREANADDADESADAKEPLHGADDGQLATAVSSMCDSRPPPFW